jgi:CP family cyanate transporter-like MFS transporter
VTIPGAADGSRRFRRVWLAVGLLMVGLNLRPAIVAVSPLLSSIETTTGISPAAGVLTALPVFCYGAFAPFAPRLVRRAGPEATTLGVLVLLAVAFAVRLPGTVWALYLGAFLAGAAIVIGNVLLPGFIKRDFPDKANLMTGLYTAVLIGGGTLTSGLTVPVQHAASFGWRPALAMWGVLVIIAIACWAPRVRAGHRPEPVVSGQVRGVRGLWREALTWQVSLFMGLQALDYYTAYSWLPDFFSARGLSAGQAGWMLSFSSICGLAASLGTPFLARRRRG